MRIFLVVKSFVPTHLKKDFDDWYENEHLSEAKQSFSAISSSRGWEIENEDIHYAYYEFDNLKKANEILKSEELKNISSVFLNRLDKNMKLQSDVTVAYALNKKGNNLKTLDLKSKNHFNTYRYKGLPPTPICYPGEKAILAVLYPNNTDYLYFVSDGKGGHRFSKNFSEHKKNIKLWMRDLKNYGKN